MKELNDHQKEEIRFLGVQGDPKIRSDFESDERFESNRP